MRILALDSSGLVAGVAVLESENEKKDAQTIAEYTVNYKKTHSQTLLREEGRSIQVFMHVQIMNLKLWKNRWQFR